MDSASSRTVVVKGVVWVGVGMVVIVMFQLGGSFARYVGQFSPLIGAFIGGGLAMVSASFPMRRGEESEPWLGCEQLSWLLIGAGIIMWGIGESFWRYSISMGQMPFPSPADLGYSAFPLLVFVGLLLQPSPTAQGRRIVLVMDSLIATGSILAIAWYLLLGPLAQAPGEASFAKFLGLYYPTSDTALLSCIVFLLLRGQARAYQSTARRVSLLLVGVGLCFFVASDFMFNIQQNMGSYVEATWLDLGWPLGMMTMGIAAYLRRFLPATPEQGSVEERVAYPTFSPSQFIPYCLLGVLFLVLILDVLARDPGQQAIRPVLLFATLGVVGLVVMRQIFTLWENTRLAQRQAEALAHLESANQQIAEQARQIAEQNNELERGIEHMKSVQARLANGNLQARARLTRGALLPLAGSLNLMADRLSRLGEVSTYAQSVLKALSDVSAAFERGTPLAIPESCHDITEISRLLVALRVKRIAHSEPSASPTPTITVVTPIVSGITRTTTQPLGPSPLRRPTRPPVTQPLK